jgi:hypothetical protein
MLCPSVCTNNIYSSLLDQENHEFLAHPSASSSGEPPELQIKASLTGPCAARALQGMQLLQRKGRARKSSPSFLPRSFSSVLRASSTMGMVVITSTASVTSSDTPELKTAQA